MSGQTNLENTGISSSEANPAVPAETPMAHSKFFGPSASHSWLRCPYSAIARNTIPDKSSIYAETGHLAHELCEIKLKLYFKQITAEEYQNRLQAIESNELFAADMLSNSECC